jgi:hypothetical protein
MLKNKVGDFIINESFLQGEAEFANSTSKPHAPYIGYFRHIV